MFLFHILLTLPLLGQSGRIGINTIAPKTTMDVNGQKDSFGNLLTADPTGLHAPRLTRAELTAKGDALYNTDHTGAVVYITDVSGGNNTGTQRANIPAAGYYYFDGNSWQKISNKSDFESLDTTTDAFVNDAAHMTVKLGTKADGTTARATGTEFVIHDQGRVGIGTASPHPDSILDLVADAKAMVFPRVQSVYKITSPTEGMVAYNKTYKSLMLYDGTSWISLSPNQHLYTAVMPQKFENLIVTNGSQWLKRINNSTNKLGIYDGTSRAQVNNSSFISGSSRIRFRFLGNAPNDIPLADGTVRRQIGLKITSPNTCNVLYAMWKIEDNGNPASEALNVSLKRNDGMTTQAQLWGWRLPEYLIRCYLSQQLSSHIKCQRRQRAHVRSNLDTGAKCI